MCGLSLSISGESMFSEWPLSVSFVVVQPAAKTALSFSP
jgi:hypothetical protein